MNAQQTDLSSEDVIDRMARAVDLTIPLDIRTGVMLAFDRLANAAAEIMDFPLSADADSAQVIVP
ncbi:AtzG-like protein [Acidisphaera sp. S103]|uniref:AtzG-like protein n=1 Tax=Acidisphaera sp. S103 TaxID=1747223 RepID=UPI00131DD77C|nr:AtzG-like protein [Acidisphaera sp. S103]